MSRRHKAVRAALIEEKAQIAIAVARERAHIDSLKHKMEARQESIRETLAVLRNTQGAKESPTQSPSI
jgi:hypothetical protein